MPRKRSVEVRSTPLGRGVFAGRSFERDEVVGAVRGRIVDDPEYDSRYCIDLGGWSMEPHAPFRFLNHSCVPNCQFVYSDEAADNAASDDPARSLWVETLRPIEVGEELLIDYAWPAEAAIPCLCGTEACRGWIVALEDLPQLQ